MCMCYEGECKHRSGYKLPIKKVKNKVVVKAPEANIKEEYSDSINFRVRVGKRMVSARKMAGLSLEEASKLFGFSKQTLNRYELGRVEINSEIICRFANAYKLPVDFFFRKEVKIEFGKIKMFCKYKY